MRAFRSVLLLPLALTACFDKEEEKPQMPPAEVSAIKVAPADVPLVFEYSGRTAGSREVEVRARVDGIIVKRKYNEGERVKAGQTLFVIDPEVYKAQLQQSSGQLADQQALLVRAKADFDRVAELFKEKAISGREYDQAKATYLQAKAGVTTAKGQLQASKINVNYTTVQAPISGATSKENRSEGSYIQANSENSLLTRITQLDPLYVNFAYPDSDALSQRAALASGGLKLTEGKELPVEIAFADGTVYPVQGTVDFTDSFIDQATGSVSARATVPNKQSALLAGQFVRVRVKGITRPNTIAVPAKAVMQGPQGTFVYVVSPEGKAAIKPVTVGMLSPAGQIVEKGLNPGDTVITEGVIKVRPDAPVKVVDPNAVPAEAKGDPDAGKTPGVPDMSGKQTQGEGSSGKSADQDDATSKGGDDGDDDVDSSAQTNGKPAE